MFGSALRALLLRVSMERVFEVTVYAPNAPHQHPEFWNTISGALNLHPLHPEILLGDFNLVEDAIDHTLLRLGLVTSRSSCAGSVFKVISGRIRFESVVQVIFDM